MENEEFEFPQGNDKGNVVLFLQELVQRFIVKTPKYFRIWQWILGALWLITGLPAFLLQFNIHLPELWNDFMSKAVSYCAAGAFFMTLMTSQSKPIAIEKNGDIVKTTNPDKLPFTAKHEAKQAIKNETNDLT